MYIVTVGNVRTTASSADGLSPGFNIVLRSGAVMGLAVGAVGLAGLS